MSDANDPDTGFERFCIAICTKNRVDGVLRAVSSALANEGAKVVLVDQNDDDRLGPALAAHATNPAFERIRITRAGAGHARNVALAATDHPIVCFTDDDCAVPTDYAAALTAVLEAEPDSGLVFCNVRQAGDSDQPGYSPLYEIEATRRVDGFARKIRVEDMGIGAGMAIRRSSVEAAGGFDNAMGPGSTFPSADDREMALRLLLRDFTVVDSPTTTVDHFGFRADGAEGRAHTKRDFIAMGAMMAKLIKARIPGATRSSLAFVGRMARRGIDDSITRRRPSGFGKLVWSVVGLSRGLRHPFDRESLRYKTEPCVWQRDADR